jgi:alkylation response protein AidB-like acyl-CoA dehydrogenase
VFVSDANGPRLMPGRGPDWRLAYLPRADVQIIDGWDVMGLRGTGSNDVAAQAVRVAEEHTISPFFEPARHDGPLWRLPFFTLAGVALAGFPLGVARRALDALAAAAPTTGRAHRPAPLAEDATVQIEMARAEGALQAAEAFVRDAAGSLWDTAVEGDVPSVEQRARFQLSVQAAMHAALQAVDMAYTATGSRAISSSHPLQRCFRDLHVAAQHAYFSPDALERYAKVRLHIEQPLHML